MKILDTQSAMLTNYEVLLHLQDVQRRYKDHPDYEPTVTRHWKTGRDVVVYGKLQGLRLVVSDTHRYLTEEKSPLTTPNATYSAPAYRALIRRLAKYNLTKTEVLMIFNLRPKDTNALDVLVEEIDVRLTAEQQEEIVLAVAETLGVEPEAEGEEEDGEDGDEEGMEVDGQGDGV